MSKKKRGRHATAPPQPAPPAWRNALVSPWCVSVTGFVLYALWLVAYVPRTHNGLDLLFVGQQFQHSHASSTITFDPTYLATQNLVGYDGQFYYDIAVDPVNARYYVDAPAYRYTRLLYPMAARLVGLGQAALIPYSLLLVNLLAIAGGTLAISFWFKRTGYSAWFGLIYALYPGLFVALSLDLTEPLGYALIALGVFLFYFGGPRRVIWTGISFGLAALTREITIIFPIFYAVSVLLGSREAADNWRRRLATGWRPASALFVLSTLPLGVYKLFLLHWLGSSGVGDYSLLQLPFHGLFSLMPWQSWHIKEIWGIVLPALILLTMGLWAVLRRIWAVEVWILLAHSEVCVVGLTATSYDAFMAPARIATGLTLVSLLCIPHLDRLSKPYLVKMLRTVWLAPCVILWSTLWLDWAATMSRIFPA